jgi:ABC-type Zn uptake system ZnuABC Zn-binding protein ZnuA
MQIEHIILEESSVIELEKLLDQNAKNGFKAISLNNWFNPNIEQVVYTALMVKYGSNYESDDITVHIYEKLESIDSNLSSIENNTR